MLLVRSIFPLDEGRYFKIFITPCPDGATELKGCVDEPDGEDSADKGHKALCPLSHALNIPPLTAGLSTHTRTHIVSARQTHARAAEITRCIPEAR